MTGVLINRRQQLSLVHCSLLVALLTNIIGGGNPFEKIFTKRKRDN